MIFEIVQTFALKIFVASHSVLYSNGVVHKCCAICCMLNWPMMIIILKQHLYKMYTSFKMNIKTSK